MPGSYYRNRIQRPAIEREVARIAAERAACTHPEIDTRRVRPDMNESRCVACYRTIAVHRWKGAEAGWVEDYYYLTEEEQQHA